MTLYRLGLHIGSFSGASGLRRNNLQTFQAPDLYNSINECQKRDSLITLETYKHWLGNSSGQRILDVGSGSGNVTMEILLPRLSKNFISLVGVDKSESMVKYARAHNKDSRVSFIHLDIEEQNNLKLRSAFKTEDLKHGFDKVFSFFCLHWTYDNRKSLSNIFYLLRPGGKALLIFPVHSPLFGIWKAMFSNDRWKHYLKDYDSDLLKFPFHFSDNGLENYKEVLEETGFEVSDCRLIPSGFIVTETSKGLHDIMKTVDPLVNLIPEKFHSEYIDDVVHKASSSITVRFGSLMLPNNIIVAAVKKPNY